MTVTKQPLRPLTSSSAFPAPIYRETVLERVFSDAKRYFLDPMLEIEYAHTLMLARQNIMPSNEAAMCIRALDALDLTEIRDARYDDSFEDIFFLIKNILSSACGAEIAGKMHTARSRNDIDLTMYRMLLRDRIREIVAALLD